MDDRIKSAEEIPTEINTNYMQVDGGEVIEQPIINSTELPKKENWSDPIRQKMISRREANRKNKFDELAKIYSTKLDDLVKLYFTYYSEEPEENTESFNLLNKEWMEICIKVSQTNSRVITLPKEGFSLRIKEIEESEIFKNRFNEIKKETENG